MTSTIPLPDVRRATAYGRISEDDLDRRDGVDTVVVRHLDRLWRDDLEAAKGRALFKQYRVLIAEYGGMEYPMWTAHGQHMARTMSGNGTFESDIKSERVREHPSAGPNKDGSTAPATTDGAGSTG